MNSLKNSQNSKPLSRNEMIQYVALLEEQKRRQERRRLSLQFEKLYGWQRKFIGMTAANTATMLMAANQVGKTMTGLTIDAMHLTGDYPDDWEGHRFEHPPMCWLLGYSMEKTRDLLQGPLFGKISNGGAWPGGLVPADRIIGHTSSGGTANAMREVRVRHKSGGTAIVQFWSYSQGQHAIMGDVVDWFHIDEEPKDTNIFPQVLTRTANGDNGRGGRGILTFTPENGRTPLVKQFMDEANEGQAMMRATWDDAPHLSPETKRRLLGLYPEWQRDMRTKGLPLLGSGLIFDFGNDKIECNAFEIPDHWWLINGCDFGWDHPQAHIQLAWDKDEDTIYVTHAWKRAKVSPEVAWGAVRPWNEGVPVAWPHDGHQHDKGSAQELRSTYQKTGFKMLADHATWPAGGNGVEAGLVELYNLMDTGKFKVFKHLSEVFEEKLQYHRDENGNIVKIQDDLLAAIRYAYMMRRFAIQKIKLKPAEAPKPEYVFPVGNAGWMR